MIFGLLFIILFSIGLLSLGSYIAWWYPLELFSHFRVQYLFISIIFSITVLLSRWQKKIDNKTWFRIIFLSSLMIISLNVVPIIPWYLNSSQKIDINNNINENKQFRILSFNVNIQNQQYQDIVNVVKENNPDIALFIEIDQSSMNQIKPGLDETFPYYFKSPGGGLALFSRLPLKDTRGDTLNAYNHNLLATVEISGKQVQLVGTHPFIPLKRSTFHQRNLQLDALVKFIQKEQKPLIVLGDFNLTPWSPYYRRFVEKTGLHNTSLGYGVNPTYPRPASYVRYPKFMIPFINIPIDHCFVSKEFKVVNYRVAENANSDHAPIMTDLFISV